MPIGLFYFIPLEADHFFCGVISYSLLVEFHHFLGGVKFIFSRFPIPIGTNSSTSSSTLSEVLPSRELPGVHGDDEDDDGSKASSG